MTLIQSLTDPTTWDTIKGLSPIFIILAVGWVILWVVFCLLSRPRNSTIYEPKTTHSKPRGWPISRYSMLKQAYRKFNPKSGSYRLKNAQQRNTSTNESAIAATGADIDRHINQQYIANSIADYRERDRRTTEYYAYRVNGSGRDKF